MKNIEKILLILTGIICLSILPYTGTASADSFEEIFNWVANEMKIQEKYPSPEVNIISKEELNRIFSERLNESSMQISEEMKKYYLDEVVGLFIPETKVIYVSNLPEKGKRESVIAHEIVHYLQDVTRGIISPTEYKAGQKHLFREMQAEMIGDRFYKQFYSDE